MEMRNIDNEEQDWPTPWSIRLDCAERCIAIAKALTLEMDASKNVNMLKESAENDYWIEEEQCVQVLLEEVGQLTFQATIQIEVKLLLEI